MIPKPPLLSLPPDALVLGTAYVLNPAAAVVHTHNQVIMKRYKVTVACKYRTFIINYSYITVCFSKEYVIVVLIISLQRFHKKYIILIVIT